ncbi:MAG: carboxypeptidase regulatory-like domain-containing protein [Acidobacteria bacterium]|nr:carboxypeptidase regulatory-like domain-containing protein [Acidobacteriota bacterium]
MNEQVSGARFLVETGPLPCALHAARAGSQGIPVSSGGISGVLRDGSTGDPLPEMGVWILRKGDTGWLIVRNLTTREDGSFFADSLPPGTYFAFGGFDFRGKLRYEIQGFGGGSYLGATAFDGSRPIKVMPGSIAAGVYIGLRRLTDTDLAACVVSTQSNEVATTTRM